MHPRIAWAYKGVLAEAITSGERLALVTSIENGRIEFDLLTSSSPIRDDLREGTLGHYWKTTGGLSPRRPVVN